MVATANVKTYPDAYRKLKRIAKQRRWTLAVAVDEAVKLLDEQERQHRQIPDEPTGSDRGRNDTPAPTGSNLSGTPTPIDGPHSSPSLMPTAPQSGEQSVSTTDEGLSAKSGANGIAPLKLVGESVPVVSGDLAADRPTSHRENEGG